MTSDPHRGTATVSSSASRSARGAGLAHLIETALDADKAEDIRVIDLTGKTSIADLMVIATGRSSRQVGAMAEHLAEKLKACGLHVTIEGMATCDWVLLDAGDVVVHLFRPEVRAFYQLEKMWGAPPPAAHLPGTHLPGARLSGTHLPSPHLPAGRSALQA